MRFPTRRFLALAAGALLLTGIAASQKNNTPEAMLRAAMDKETVDGDLKAAIEQYKKVIAQKGASKDVMAKALVRLGGAYEKQGSAEAQPVYERVVREFSDQGDAAQTARTRLASDGALRASRKTLREICAGADCDGEISPDGRYLSLMVDGNISVRDLATGQIRQLTHEPAGTNARGPVWAPDSKRVAYFTFETAATGMVNRQTMIVNVDGSGTRTIYRGGDAYGWSPDGKRLLIAAIDAPGKPVTLKWAGVADGVVETLPTARFSLDLAVVSPDGRYVAFNASKDKDSEENVYFMASDGAGETLVSASPAYQEPVGWTPDGKYLLFAQYADQVSLWAVPISGGKAGAPALVQRGFGDRVRFLGITQSGELYYGRSYTDVDEYTATLDPVTGKITSSPAPIPLPGSGRNLLPRYSPDGRRIVYYRPQGDSPQVRQLKIYSFDTGMEQAVTPSIPTAGGPPCWTRDGSSILFNTTRGEGPTRRDEPVRLNLATGEEIVLFPGASSFQFLSCSDRLLAGFDPSSIKVRNLQDGTEKELYKFRTRQRSGDVQPRLSRDGTQVAFFERLDRETTSLRVIPSAGGPVRELATAKSPNFLSGYCAAWSADDRFIYFCRNDGNNGVETFRVPPSGGSIESTGYKGPAAGGIEVSPDGAHIMSGWGQFGEPQIWAMENFLPPAR